jgi:hypothetical protein
MLPPPPKAVTHTTPCAFNLRSLAHPHKIPLNTMAFAAMQTQLATVDIPPNLRPQSNGNEITYASITIFHRDALVEHGVSVYECLKKVFELLLRVDLRATILLLYVGKAGVTIASITTVPAYSMDVLGLGTE